MNSEPTNATARRPAYLRVLYILALASLIVYILTVGATLLMPLAVGALLAMLLTPFANWLEKKRLGGLASAIIPVVSLLAGFALLVSLAVRQLGSIGGSLEGTAERVGDYVERINAFFSWHLNLDRPVLGEFDSEGLVDLVRDYSDRLLSMMGGFTEPIFGALIVPALTFFILYYRHHLFEFTVRFLKDTPRDKVKEQVEASRMVAHNYFVGMMKVVAVLAVINSVALFLIGVEHAIFFGVFAAVLNIVPFIGPLVGSILPVLYVFLTKDSLLYPFIVAATFIVIQLVESNFLTPRIVGSNVRINPLIVFTGLLGGALVWGVIGMIIIIPILSIAMQLFRLNPRTEPFAYLFGTPPK